MKKLMAIMVIFLMLGTVVPALTNGFPDNQHVDGSQTNVTTSATIDGQTGKAIFTH